ncbi:hypothetical protein K450DRAFT_256579 [Umbelopsis ramanniana AG]|uniref:BHLH domain-containing protein n=1 Tax=Umbelopsis ramanniana AG TaxID=1314678 RepID=A0AAD5E4E9_UMBRA|nr:uncharacterized protein K450DRAFT_256579 [Umbelopsis ramanniana AG]KAI8576519.1 hypothetical protein K450DRAFT_256579 [Umbelopsis ramanniana AG]
MNPAQASSSEHHGMWPSGFFSAPGLKQHAQSFMSGMGGFAPSWEKQMQFAQQKQRQAQMLLLSQQQNVRITAGSPLDMEMPTSPIRMTSPRKTGKADRRAEHNAIERARRESLNVKFQQLAHALPNLQDDRRPSKSRIVEKALEWVRQTFIREQQYRHEIQQLRLDNEHLRAQLVKQSNLKGVPSGLSDMDVPPPPVASAPLDMLSFSNWNSLSAEYLFEPAPLGDDHAEQQDDDDNSSNDGDFESERTTSFYGEMSDMQTSPLDLQFSSAMLHQEMKSAALIPSDMPSIGPFRHR